MTAHSIKVKKLARTLLRENLKNGRSWRAIAHEDYDDQINYATLNRFAIHKGTWLPKNEKILVALGLKRSCTRKSKRMFDMSTKELLWCLTHRKEMQ